MLKAPTAVATCPCCQQSVFELLPNKQRRLGAVCAQMEALSVAPQGAAGATSEPSQGVSSPAWARQGGAALSPEQVATKGTEPFRLLHTEGPDAVESSMSSGSHRGPAQEWPMQNLADDKQFKTPWRFIHTGMMMPGAGIGEHIHGNCEEIFFCLDPDAHAEFIYNGRKAQVQGPACVPCRAGDSHGIFNNSDKPFRWFNINCCMPGMTYDAVDLEKEGLNNKPGGAYEQESADRIPVGRFDRSLLEDPDTKVRAGGRPPLRPGGGAGQIFAREMWGERDFRSCFRYLRQYALPPSTSIGPYTRDLIEDVFFIMSGDGIITIDGTAHPVRAGDVVFAGLGETREITGPTNGANAELFFWNVGAAMDHDVDETADCTAVA